MTGDQAPIQAVATIGTEPAAGEVLTGELLDAENTESAVASAIQMMSDLAQRVDEYGKPVPIIQGSFAIYQSPKGELILVTETPERGVERKIFPARMVKMFGTGMFARMMGMGK